MHQLKSLVLVTVLSLAALCGTAGTAPATTIEPANTAFALTATNATLQVASGFDFNCDSTISGTTPAGDTSDTTIPIPVTMVYSACTASGFNATVTEPGCHSAATKPTLTVMGLAVSITLPATCVFTYTVASTGCDLIITGGERIGNGTAGTGGANWTNRSPKSGLHLNGTHVPVVHSNGMGLGCPTLGVHTGAMLGTYTSTTTANVTVTGG
jgi:hypothetical protein